MPYIVKYQAKYFYSLSMKFPIGILFLLFLVSLSLTICFTQTHDAELSSKIQLEIVKSLLQLLVIIIVGGGIAAIFKWIEGKREITSIRAATRVDYFRRLGNIYRIVKAARRELRSGGLTNIYKEPISLDKNQIQLYCQQMESINEAQLELEGLKIESKSLPDFLSLGGISDQLNLMENYLREILHEFEEFAPKFKNDSCFNFTDFKKLNEFTGKTHEKNGEHHFRKDFSTPYYTAAGILSESFNI